MLHFMRSLLRGAAAVGGGGVAVSHYATTFTTIAVDKNVVFTPAVGDLVVVVVALTDEPDFALVQVFDSEGGTYTRITNATAVKASSADTAAIFVRNSLIASAVSTTVYLDTDTSGATITGSGLSALKVTGMTKTGATAVLQSSAQNNRSSSGTPAPVLAGAMTTTNAGIGFVFSGTNSSTTVTPRSGWTELVDQGFASPNAGLEIMARDSGETASTITWGSTVGSAFCCGVIELDTTP